MIARLCLAAALACAAACGGSSAFRLTARDNDPERLEAAFARMKPPAPGPKNQTGRPLAFLVTGTKPRALIAFDLERKAQLWRVSAEVTSKVVVGRSFIAHGEKDALVGRDVASGAVLWRASLGGRLVGAAADQDRLYVTVEAGSGRWELFALDGKSGDELWREESPGALGAPAAVGGLVFSPFLRQWLAVLDGATGDPLARIRGIDEAITFVRADGGSVFFGSPTGVYLLDRRAASGKRAQSTYGAAELPDEFVRVHYGPDAFDPVQAGYTAYDRNRILWRARPEGKSLRFEGDRVVVHTFRFFFGFNAASGELAWAYSHPRVDAIGSAHLGAVIAFAAAGGALGALDPATGRPVYQARVRGPLVGVTFDAAGWAPREQIGGEPPGTAAVLAAIATDRDTRFTDVKKFAIAALGAQKGEGAVRDLVALVQSEEGSPELRDAAAQALIARRDPAALPILTEALEVRHDYLAGTRPRAVGALARAVASLARAEIAAADRERAVAALVAQLRAPETPEADLDDIVAALAAIGGGAEVEPLRAFVLLYRADPAFVSDAGAVGRALEALAAAGGAGVELVRFVAGDPRTQPAVKAVATRALPQKPTEDPNAAGKAPPAAAEEPTATEKAPAATKAPPAATKVPPAAAKEPPASSGNE